MDKINDFLTTLDGYLGGSSWFPVLLLGVGIFFTIYLKFPQLRFFRHATKIVTGKYEKASFKGDTTHFQALATALSGTVGTGNIGGVGLALYIGGPAALFWMWATAFFGMTTKFVECTLSHKYRDIHEDGSVSGGPMYYMEKKLNMKWLAVIFAVATVVCAFGTGNMPQINNIAASMNTTFHIAPWITGAILSVLLAMIIIGGIKRIAKVTEKIVPFMAVVYVIGAFGVIFGNIGNLIPSFLSIFRDAFSGSAALGGFMGASFAYALNRGVNRGIYSNEAGQGSAAIAHASAKADEPVSEGMVAILEPFIDTLLICTLTGLAILSSGVWIEKHDNVFQHSDMKILQEVYQQDNPDHIRILGAHIQGKEDDIEENQRAKPFSGQLQLVQGKLAASNSVTVIHARSIAEEMIFKKDGTPIDGTLEVTEGRIEVDGVTVEGKSLVHSAVLTTIAFKRGLFGNSGEVIVSIGLLLFAFSTVISWSYYGDRAVVYLVGAKYVLPYRILYVIAFFAAALMDTTVVWNLAYVLIVLMTIPNLLGIMMLHKDMKQSVKDYWKKFKQEYPEDASNIKVSELKD
ncbi:MAG: amino acid carrier protein [bacterium]|nr:amino acid carrier protein [bacterium]